MSEKHLIENTSVPRTRDSIAKDLRDMGLKEGMIILVHSSLKSLGWVSGGPVAVIQALMDVVTDTGTIIMPTHTGDYSDPSLWGNPAVPKQWIDIIKDTMPAYEPEITPTRGMGAIVETFRKFPGVIRSSHPHHSFAAYGKYAEKILIDHSLDYSLGEESLLAKIYGLDGWVLLLGVGYDSNTSFHLAEYRSGLSNRFKGEAPIIENDKRVWKIFDDIEFDTDVFEDIGKDFEENNNINIGQIGSSKSKLFNQKVAVDYATEWLKNKSK
ncbi:AAC(3) family N-acetyltransferase [Clostridium sp. D2Q-11]|uniref:Aminoglycoside N(3)-acetyltransferase n=1 Tax=Anaeromonas frigoriresistens TaxID=2683708 RepID=A0A942UR51_9FIRM|nr:AAC(3) family N-acetyltransferase [Anaeromonas frigoriresistens]MBS4537043.1 AAC(3) family N-acetyltransferase [Anaeromonas frigoriresistens]